MYKYRGGVYLKYIYIQSVELWTDSQVLELGIVIHSVIIGISLGTSQSPATIKPLLVALSFHQFFEGMGLGGCISQVNSNYISFEPSSYL